MTVVDVHASKDYTVFIDELSLCLLYTSDAADEL